MEEEEEEEGEKEGEREGEREEEEEVEEMETRWRRCILCGDVSNVKFKS